jgi:hypothetical protein
VDESDSDEPSSPLNSNNDKINLGNPKVTSPTPKPVINEDDPSSQVGTNEPVRPQVKLLAKRR